MNNSQQTIRVGLFFLLGVALAWITFESLSGGQIFKKEGYTLIANVGNNDTDFVGDGYERAYRLPNYGNRLG